MERLKAIKEKLLCALECEMSHLDTADAKEMGEVMDMIKDVEEACYYHSVVEAMEKDDNGEETYRHLEKYTPYRRYYTPNGHKPLGRWDNYDGYLWENDMPRDMRKTHIEDTPNSKWEGRSPAARRTYMESKEMHKDTKEQMQKLEDYMKELSTDITDMIKDATPQEKTALKQKLNTLVTMIYE